MIQAENHLTDGDVEMLAERAPKYLSGEWTDVVFHPESKNESCASIKGTLKFFQQLIIQGIEDHASIGEGRNNERTY